MDYKKIYDNLVNRAAISLRSKATGYYEQHHIVPKCIGGSNDPANLVLLTAREHFLAHWMLVKIHPDNVKIFYAWNCFSLNQRGKRPVSRLYEYCRLRLIAHLKQNKIRGRVIGKTVSTLKWMNNGIQSTRVSNGEIQNYVDAGWVMGRLTFIRGTPSSETKAKMSKANKGRDMPWAHKMGRKGKVWVNNGQECRMVYPDEVQALGEVWIKGRT